MALNLWLPSSKDDDRQMLGCRICKRRFPASQQRQFERHVLACFKRHEEEVLMQAPARRAPAFYEAPDPEWESYNAELRARGINPEEQYDKRRRRPLREN